MEPLVRSSIPILQAVILSAKVELWEKHSQHPHCLRACREVAAPYSPRNTRRPLVLHQENIHIGITNCRDVIAEVKRPVAVYIPGRINVAATIYVYRLKT